MYEKINRARIKQQTIIRLKAHAKKLLWLFVTLTLITSYACNETGKADDRQTVNEGEKIKPMDGAVWLEEEGMRAAWLGYRLCSDEILDYMVESRCNVLMLAHSLTDFLDVNSARWQGDKLVVDYNRECVDSLIAITMNAASRGIRTIFMSEYQLNRVLPTLKRLGYSRAYVEAPTRVVTAGLKDDASPFDKTLWHGLIGAHGDHVAQLSLKYPIEGNLYDTEHYDGGIMYLQGCGFGDDSFAPYLKERGINKTEKNIPPGTRYEYLKNSGLLHDYWNYLEEKMYSQGRDLAKRWHATNPNLLLGIWVLFDNWFSRGFLRGLGGEVPSLGLSHCEYASGSFQSRSMAEYYEGRIPNMKYMPGFIRGNTPGYYEYNMAQVIESMGRYWLLAPDEMLKEQRFRTSLSNAYEKGQKVKTASDKPAVDLDYSIVDTGNEPKLVVQTRQKKNHFRQAPRITLRSVRGGAPLCENLTMERASSGHYRAEIPLIRLLTNNRYQQDGYKSGVCYEYHPVPTLILGEDVQHTKLTDGRAYGYTGSTVLWDHEINHVDIVLDLHKEYKITRIALSQPHKLEDYLSIPSEVTLDLGVNENEWEHSIPFKSYKNHTEDYHPVPPEVDVDDSSLMRCWLSRFAEDINENARYLRIRIKKEKTNVESVRNVISMGEVMIWGQFNGEIQAAINDADSYRVIKEGKRFNVPQ